MSEAQAAPQVEPGGERVGAKTFGLVSLAILSSRVLGLVREVVLSALFASRENLRWLDCFNMAFKAPNMLRDLFAEGALSTAFITVFTRKTQTEGEDAAWSLARKMMTLATVFMTLVSALGVLLAPWIIWLLASGWRHPSNPKNALTPDELAAKIEFTVTLARIMYPFILLVSLAALVMGMLNARKVFFVPAMSSTFFNVGSMVAGGLIGWWLDPHFGRVAVIGFAIGTLVGGLLQLAVQFPSLRRVGFHFGLDFGWKDPGVRHTLQLMWPAIVSGSVVQVSVMLNAIFASHVAGDGPVTWLYSAFRLMQLPLGLFGVGLATISLPSLARLATHGIGAEFRGTLSRALRLGALLSVPSAVGLAILALPIMSLVYGNGAAARNPLHVPGCAAALQTYALGLVFYSGLKVLQPAFYAIERRFVPLVVSVICVVVTASLNYLFVIRWHLDHRYLALSTSITAALNFTLLFLAMRRFAGSAGGIGLQVYWAKLAVAATCMAGVCWAARLTLLAGWTGYGLPLRIVTLGVTIAVAAGVYFGVNLLLRNDEVEDLRRRVLRRFQRKK